MRTQVLVGKIETALRRESDARALRLEVKSLEIRARALEGDADALRSEVLAGLVEEGRAGFDTETLAVSRYLGPPRVELDAEVDEKACTWRDVPLPERYIVVKQSINRTLLIGELKGGLNVGFARLVREEQLKVERIAAGSEPAEEF